MRYTLALIAVWVAVGALAGVLVRTWAQAIVFSLVACAVTVAFERWLRGPGA